MPNPIGDTELGTPRRVKMDLEAQKLYPQLGSREDSASQGLLSSSNHNNNNQSDGGSDNRKKVKARSHSWANTILLTLFCMRHRRRDQERYFRFPRTLLTLLILFTCMFIWHVYGQWAWYGVRRQAYNIYDALPADQKVMPRVDNANTLAISKEMRTFFDAERERYKGEVDLEAYTWVLTMVAALRYGSNAVHDGKELYVTDHDIDIMIAAPGKSSQWVYDNIQTKLVEHLNKQGWFSFLFQPEGFKVTACVASWDYSQMGWFQTSQEVVLNQLKVKGQTSPMLASIVGTKWLRQFVQLPVWTHVSFIDFHFSQTPIPRSDARKVFWGGHAWPYPAKEAQFVEHFNYYCGHINQEDLNIHNVCDFYEPHWKWPDDCISASDKKFDILNACQSDLQQRGYYSLHHCAHPSKNKSLSLPQNNTGAESKEGINTDTVALLRKKKQQNNRNNNNLQP